MVPSVEYSPVPAELQNCYATLHRCTLHAGVKIRVPAILGQVWLNTAPVWWLAPGANAPQQLPAVALLGPTSAAFDLMPEGDGVLYGCGLWPLGWAEIVRRNAGDMADRVLSGLECWPDCTHAWQHATPRDASEQGWAALLTFAEELAQTRRPSPDAGRIAVIDVWLNATESAEMLCESFGLSSRQVARITCRTHGGPPRLIAAKWRALRAAAELGLTDHGGVHVWDRYADQSHFIREFRRFIGSTPGVFSEDESSIPRRVVADPWHVASDHPLALFHGDRKPV